MDINDMIKEALKEAPGGLEEMLKRSGIGEKPGSVRNERWMRFPKPLDIEIENEDYYIFFSRMYKMVLTLKVSDSDLHVGIRREEFKVWTVDVDGAFIMTLVPEETDEWVEKLLGMEPKAVYPEIMGYAMSGSLDRIKLSSNEMYLSFSHDPFGFLSNAPGPHFVVIIDTLHGGTKSKWGKRKDIDPRYICDMTEEEYLEAKKILTEGEALNATLDVLKKQASRLERNKREFFSRAMMRHKIPNKKAIAYSMDDKVFIKDTTD